MTNEYSTLKAAWHLEKIARLRDGLQIIPTHVQLIISDLCNQNCSFCAYRMEGGFSTEQFGVLVGAKGVNFTLPDIRVEKNPNRRIPYDKACEILSDCRDLGVGAIQFTGGGEPTVHPQHVDIFKHAQQLGLKTGLVTNGLVVREPQVLADMDWVRFSLDAGCAETYEAIRESKGFSKVLENIEKVVKCGTPCHIGIGFVVTRGNYREIYDACRISLELGVKYIRLAAMFSEEGSSYYDGVRLEIEEFLSAVRGLECPDFKILDLFSQRISDLDQESPKHPFCGYQNFTTYIGGDLKVYRCCTTSYTEHGEVGDLSNMSFAKWISSWEKKEEYTDFDARTCHHCQFHAANEVINYMIDQKPNHVDFV